jgi:hypothetical protein
MIDTMHCGTDIGDVMAITDTHDSTKFLPSLVLDLAQS